MAIVVVHSHHQLKKVTSKSLHYMYHAVLSWSDDRSSKYLVSSKVDIKILTDMLYDLRILKAMNLYPVYKHSYSNKGLNYLYLSHTFIQILSAL